MTLPERLNKNYKNKLDGRKIIWSGDKIVLTDDEIFLIGCHLDARNRLGEEYPIFSPISRRCSLDFIGWDDPKYNDVLIVKWKKKNPIYKRS